MHFDLYQGLTPLAINYRPFGATALPSSTDLVVATPRWVIRVIREIRGSISFVAGTTHRRASHPAPGVTLYPTRGILTQA